VVVGSFLLSTLKPDAKVDSPLRLTQGVTSGMTTLPVAQQHPGSKGSSGTSKVSRYASKLQSANFQLADMRQKWL